MSQIIIIPSLNPDEKLILLANKLKQNFDRIIVIDDGSGEEFKGIFEVLKKEGIKVFHHDVNMGKGAAIKTAVKKANELYHDIDAYITADADGQHKPDDILRIAKEAKNYPNALILGTRNFKNDNVPLRSWFGNTFSSMFFRLDTGKKCSDTQTGLRLIPYSLTEDMLNTEGSRYEYEMNFLTYCAKNKIDIIEIPIETVYNDNNKGSHFHTIKDSVRIYKTPLKFIGSSLFCAGVDIGIFYLLTTYLSANVWILASLTKIISGNVWSLASFATVVARLCSGALNFTINKKFSFKAGGNLKKQLTRYFILFTAQMLISAALVSGLSVIPINLSIIKAIVDACLFVLSYTLQRNWVFKKD